MTLIEVYRESKEIKRLIVERSIKYKIPIRYICKQVGIEYLSFMHGYINSSSSENYNITEEQMAKILGLLGVSVRFNFIIDDKFNEYTHKRDVEEWIIKQKTTKIGKKERDTTDDQ